MGDSLSYGYSHFPSFLKSMEYLKIISVLVIAEEVWHSGYPGKVSQLARLLHILLKMVRRPVLGESFSQERWAWREEKTLSYVRKTKA